MIHSLKNLEINELKKENLRNISGGLGTLPLIFAVGGIATLASAYVGLCDSVHGMGVKIGKALAK